MCYDAAFLPTTSEHLTPSFWAGNLRNAHTQDVFYTIRTADLGGGAYLVFLVVVSVQTLYHNRTPASLSVYEYQAGYLRTEQSAGLAIGRTSV